jgi:hypothetical protein
MRTNMSDDDPAYCDCWYIPIQREVLQVKDTVEQRERHVGYALSCAVSR